MPKGCYSRGINSPFFNPLLFSKDSPIQLTASLLSLTLVIPLLVIGGLFWTLQKRAEKKIQTELEMIREKKTTESNNQIIKLKSN